VIPALRSELASLPRVYWLVWLGTLVNKMGAVVIPFLTIYLTRRGYSAPEAGLVLSVYGGGAVVASLGGGLLADKVGRRFTLLLSLFGGAAATLCIGLSTTLPTILVSTFAMGALAEMYRPAVAAMVTDVVPVAQRAKAFAHLYWVVNLGFALAASLGGLATGLGFFALFVIDAVAMATYGVIVFLFVPESKPKLSRGERPPTVGLAPVLGDGIFMAVVLLSFGVALVMWQNGSSAPIDMQRNGISAREFGLLYAINGLLIVFLQPWLTAQLRALPRTAVLAGSSIVFGLGMGLYGFVGATTGYALAIVIWSIGEIAHLPTLQTVVADLAPPDKRGRYQGFYNLAWAGASLVGPLAGGAMLAGPGSRALWLACFAVLGLVAVGHLLAGRARHAREVAPRASTGQIG
jgi:MFS family permease